MEYTEEEHAGNLIELLENPDARGCCPVPEEFRPKIGFGSNRFGCTEYNHVAMCKGFLGVENNIHSEMCPFGFFGEQEAIKRTWLALEAKGYLD